MRNISATLDARDEGKDLIVPMVIRKRKINEKMMFTGFVPGFEGRDVIEENIDDCKKKLSSKTQKTVEKMLKENSPFPFFPTKEELMQDFDDVVSICFVKIPNNKIKKS